MSVCLQTSANRIMSVQILNQIQARRNQVIKMSYHHFLLDHPHLLVDTVVHLLHLLVLLLLGYNFMAKLIIVSIETFLSKFWNVGCVEHYSCILKDFIKIGICIIPGWNIVVNVLCKLHAGQLSNHGKEIFLCPTVFRWQ